MTKFEVNGEEVFLDPSNLDFSEETLNDYICKIAAICAYYNHKWAEAQYEFTCAEDVADVVYCKKFEMFKLEGNSDKLSEARAKADKDVVDARASARRQKLYMQELFGYLRALDKAHTNALNLGYNVRKEMDKIHPGIKIKDKDIDAELEKLFAEG